MPIFTSSFARVKLFPPDLRPVSIARWPPRFWKGERYYPLAPSANLLRSIKAGAIDWAEYCDQYAAQLAALDPVAIVRDLGSNAALLCFEAPGEPCHRRLAAEWLESALGIEVPEWEVQP